MTNLYKKYSRLDSLLLVLNALLVQAREKDATGYEQEVGNKIAESLRLLIHPYFLRRTKAEVFSNTKNENSNKENGANQQDGKSNNDENSSTMQSKS